MKGYGEQIDEICAILDGAKVPEVVATTQTDLDGNSVEEFLHSPDRVRILVQERDALREHVAAEQQAQGDAEGLRAALRSAARDLQTANQWSWEARWPADRIRWFAERSEVCRAAAKAGLPPKRPVKAEDCPGSGEGEQGGGEWVAWTPERRAIAVGDWVRRPKAHHVAGVTNRVVSECFGIVVQCRGFDDMSQELDLWQSPDGTPPPGVEE